MQRFKMISATGLTLLMLGTAMSTASGQETYRSPLAVAAGEKFAYVAEFGASDISVVDVEMKSVDHVIPLSGQPTGLALGPGGKQLFVTVAGATGKVLVINLEKRETEAVLNAGHTPAAPVISPDGKTLFVCNRFNNDVSVFDLNRGVEALRIPVTREPVAAAISPDGKWLAVANLLPSGSATADYVGAVVNLIRADTRTPDAVIPLPNGSTSVEGICVSPDGRFAYAAHVLARYLLPTTQLDRGWINTNAVSVIDLESRSLVNTVLLDNVDQGAPTSWGIACTPEGSWLIVSHSGSHELSVIDRSSLHAKLAESQNAGKEASVPNDLAYLVGLRTRYALRGNGPRGIATVGSRVVAAEYFSGSIGILDLAQTPSPKAESLSLGTEPEADIVRRGEMYFHDATLCFQQWQSCATCHPGDARVDGLNWDLLNDGIGNAKNNKSLLLAHETPPSMITGIRDNAEVAVRAGIRHALFVELPDEYAAAMDAYLKSLKPVPSPVLENGALSAAAQRGQAVFDATGCAKCHPAPLHTDMKRHRVGTGTGREEDTRFDTPTLVEVWRTAPYLYDGRAATIKEVITSFNAGDRHGETAALSPEAIDDLVAYVESL